MRHLHLFLTLLCLLFVLPVLPLTAQETAAGWPVETHCVGEPTTPPDGWTFEGTILATGYAGIHAVNDAWDTPHIVIFLTQAGETDGDLPGGALSPDANWYASPFGDQVIDYQTWNRIITLKNIKIYSTTNDQEYDVNISTTQFFQGDHGQIFWQDAQHFVYPTWGGTLSIDFTNGATNSLSTLDELFTKYHGTVYAYISPDWERMIQLNYIDSQAVWILYDLTNGKEVKQLSLPVETQIVWMPDSSNYVATIPATKETDSVPALGLFDLNGNQRETVFISEYLGSIDLDGRPWSSDNRFLVFSTDYRTDENQYKQQLYVADFQTKSVINFCGEAWGGFAWSPDNTMIAFSAQHNGNGRIRVLDLLNSQLHTVAYHSGSIIGWRED